jgi:hypothetical protein
VCGSTAEGTGVCVDGSTPCDGLPACAVSADCPAGQTCFVESCCGVSVCAGAATCSVGNATGNAAVGLKYLMMRAAPGNSFAKIGGIYGH